MIPFAIATGKGKHGLGKRRPCGLVCVSSLASKKALEVVRDARWYKSRPCGPGLRFLFASINSCLAADNKVSEVLARPYITRETAPHTMRTKILEKSKRVEVQPIVFHRARGRCDNNQEKKAPLKNKPSAY